MSVSGESPCYGSIGSGEIPHLARALFISKGVSQMSARTIRRAAERQALKAARKAAVLEATQSPDPFPAPAAAQPEPSAARIAANRANAQHSSGPKTAAGRAVSSLNALKAGLTGVTVLLPSDDAIAYQAHILSYEKLLKPVGPEESALVQSIADLRWRLNRIPALEYALLAIGQKELAATNEEFNRTGLTPILEMEIRRAYSKDFRNLQLQEARLSRRREKEMAELRALQAERKNEVSEDLKSASRLYIGALTNQRPFDFESHGFEFSKAQFIAFLAAQTPSILYKELTADAPETMHATA